MQLMSQHAAACYSLPGGCARATCQMTSRGIAYHMVFSPASAAFLEPIVIACCTRAAESVRPFGGRPNPTPNGATPNPTGASVVTLKDVKCARISLRQRFVALHSSRVSLELRLVATEAVVANNTDGVRKLSPGRSATWTPWCCAGPSGGGGGLKDRVRLPG